jgi:hypothetical protein
MQRFRIERESPAAARQLRRRIAALALLGLASCGGGYDSPMSPRTTDGAGTATQTVADPTGDTFNNVGTVWDLTGFTVTRDTDGVTAKLDFTADVLSPMSGDTAAIIGFVEFDLDQNQVSGVESVVDHFRQDGGTTALGVDATVDFSIFASDSTVAVYDSLAHVTGRIKPMFSGKSITMRIPRALLQNDDGFVNAAAIIGAVHRPTDFVPQTGHLTLRPAGVS